MKSKNNNKNTIIKTDTVDLGIFHLRRVVPFLKLCSFLMILLGCIYAVILLTNKEELFTVSQERSIIKFIVVAIILEMYLMVSSAKSTLKCLTRHSNVEIVAEIEKRHKVDESGDSDE